MDEIYFNIEKIKKDQGIYNDEEYAKILSFVNQLEKNLKYQNTAYYLSKNNYTYSEIATFYSFYTKSYYTENPFLASNEIYLIIHSHDYNVIDNIVKNNTYSNFLMNENLFLFEQLVSPYYNGKSMSAEIATTVKSIINIKNIKDSMLLKDIIEVGGINE